MNADDIGNVVIAPDVEEGEAQSSVEEVGHLATFMISKDQQQVDLDLITYIRDPTVASDMSNILKFMARMYGTYVIPSALALAFPFLYILLPPVGVPGASAASMVQRGAIVWIVSCPGIYGGHTVMDPRISVNLCTVVTFANGSVFFGIGWRLVAHSATDPTPIADVFLDMIVKTFIHEVGLLAACLYLSWFPN